MRNVLCFALSIADGEPVELHHLPAELLEAASPQASAQVLPFPSRTEVAGQSDVVVDLGLVDALRRHRWNITDTARELGLCRATVYRRMKREGIVPPTHSG